MKMRKIFCLILVLALSLTAFVGCNGQQETSTGEVKWTISVEGITDEALSFTNLDGENLGSKEINATMKKNDGSEKEQAWKGYGLKEVLDSLGTGEYTSVIVEAGDGYNKELTKDLVDSEGTILGVMVDGEALEEDNLVQLVIDGKGSNWWIKGVAKITVVE